MRGPAARMWPPIAATIAFLLCSCSGGGGGGDHLTTVTPVAGFTPACDTASACFQGSISLQAGVATGDVVQVEAMVNKTNTTIGVASIVIGYDPSAVDYLGFSAGTALGSAPGTVYTVSEPAAGQVVATILPPAGGVSVPNAQPAITLSFRVLKVAVTPLIFVEPDTLNGSAIYDTGGTLIPLGAGGWSGGQISGS